MKSRIMNNEWISKFYVIISSAANDCNEKLGNASSVSVPLLQLLQKKKNSWRCLSSLDKFRNVIRYLYLLRFWTMCFSFFFAFSTSLFTIRIFEQRKNQLLLFHIRWKCFKLVSVIDYNFLFVQPHFVHF